MAVINTVDQEKINVNNNGALRGVTLPAGPRLDVGPVQGGNVDRLIELYPRIQPQVTPQQATVLPAGERRVDTSVPRPGYDYLMNVYPSGGNNPYPQSTPWQNQNPYTKPNYNPGVGNGGATTYPSYSPNDPRPENTQGGTVGNTGTWPNLGGLLGQNGQDYVNGLKDWLASLRPNGQGGIDPGFNFGVGSGFGGSGGSSLIASLFGGYGTGYSGYLNQMYDEALKAQLAQLEASYQQNVSDLNASRVELDNAYREQKRQTMGTAERDAAAWREMANAYGLNSGAIGQAALAQNNQRQSNLNALETDQAAAIAEIERQRLLLGQQYQQQINAAIAENNFEKANALYQEAVRLDEKAKSLKSGFSGGGSSTWYRSPSTTSNITDTETDTGSEETKDKGGKSGGSGSGSNLSSDYQEATSVDAAEVLKKRLAEGDYTKDQQLDLIERYFDNGLISEDEATVLALKAKGSKPIKQFTK